MKKHHVYKISYKHINGTGSIMTERISICKKVEGDNITFEDIETTPRDYFYQTNLIWKIELPEILEMANIEHLGQIKEYNKRIIK